jgi:hypothetical protein
MATGRALRDCLPLLGAVSVLAFAIGLAGQQMLRAGADDPQVQLAEDAAARFAAGTAPQGLVAGLPPLEITASIGPWLAVFDARGTPLASSARLDGALPALPAGVFAAAAGAAHRVTWQPEPGVRSATVVVQAGTRGFVVAGRSLRDVEEREGLVWRLAGLAWLLALSVALALRWLAESSRGVRRTLGR